MTSNDDVPEFVCMKCGFLNPAPNKSQLDDDSPMTATANSPLTPLPANSHHLRSSSPVSPSPSNPPQVQGAAGIANKTSTAQGFDGSSEEETPEWKSAGNGAKGKHGDEEAGRGKGKAQLTRRLTRNSRKSGVAEMDLD
jgi:hypothetical protein